MNSNRWQAGFAAAMFLLSTTFYVMRWILFPEPALHTEMLRYLVDDVAFLFLQVLLVTFFIDRMAQQRKREELNRKLNMVIGAFFSEMGTELLGRLAAGETGLSDIREDLVPTADWTAEKYVRARAAFEAHTPHIVVNACDLFALRDLLVREKPYLLGLLGNQSLLEHERFTDLLWAVTHIAEELIVRKDLDALVPSDAAHVAGDLNRAFTLLGGQWIDYLRHLQEAYPYLYSLALRTNPLDPDACATVQ